MKGTAEAAGTFISRGPAGCQGWLWTLAPIVAGGTQGHGAGLHDIVILLQPPPAAR